VSNATEALAAIDRALGITKEAAVIVDRLESIKDLSGPGWWRVFFDDRDIYGRRVLTVFELGYVWIQESSDGPGAIGDMFVSAFGIHLKPRKKEAS
jgi:hypothetical protein